MLLRAKNLKIATGGPLIAIINYKDAEKINAFGSDRVKLLIGNKFTTVALNISDSEKAVKQGEIGLFEEIIKILKPKSRQKIKIIPEKPPLSLESIKKKLDGKELSKKEIDEIVKDIVNDNLTEVELTYFVAACYEHGLSEKEITNLTKSTVKNGNKLGLKKEIILDKHCVGGVPNNRTTMIIVPILAAAGLTIPKTSSRSITSPAGTADTMEVLANVNLTTKQAKKVIQKAKAAIFWGGSIELAGADNKLLKIRYPLRIDPEGLMLASILAKKAAVNATHLLIDIPVGKTAKVKTKKEARRLKNKFKTLGKKLGIKVKVLISDGSQPIGNGIGPLLEARDVLYILERNPNAPKDLEKKSIKMANILLKMVGKKKIAQQILDSGLAFKKMKEIIKLQGQNREPNSKKFQLAKFKYNVIAKKSGKIKEIDNRKISRTARIAGAPNSKTAGVYLYKKLNDKVKSGEKIFTIYSGNKTKLKYAKESIKSIIKIK